MPMPMPMHWIHTMIITWTRPSSLSVCHISCFRIPPSARLIDWVIACTCSFPRANSYFYSILSKKKERIPHFLQNFYSAASPPIVRQSIYNLVGISAWLIHYAVCVISEKCLITYYTRRCGWMDYYICFSHSDYQRTEACFVQGNRQWALDWLILISVGLSVGMKEWKTHEEERTEGYDDVLHHANPTYVSFLSFFLSNNQTLQST